MIISVAQTFQDRNRGGMSVPLKRLQQTFVDDPKELGDTNIDHLAFDIEHGLKNLNNIHTLHAIAILLLCVTDLISLLSHQDLLRQFHKEHPWQHTEKSFKLNGGMDLRRDSMDLTPTRSYIPLEELKSRKKKISEPSEPKQWTESLKDAATGEWRDQLTKIFVLVNPPAMSVRDFLLRIHTYSPAISSTVYIHLAQMVFKTIMIAATMLLTECNIHRLILTVIRCSTKLLEDLYQKQSAYATVTGVSKSDLLKFELAFLFLANFDIAVDEESLNLFLIEKWVPLYRFCRKNLDQRVAKVDDIEVDN